MTCFSPSPKRPIKTVFFCQGNKCPLCSLVTAGPSTSVVGKWTWYVDSNPHGGLKPPFTHHAGTADFGYLIPFFGSSFKNCWLSKVDQSCLYFCCPRVQSFSKIKADSNPGLIKNKMDGTSASGVPAPSCRGITRYQCLTYSQTGTVISLVWGEVWVLVLKGPSVIIMGNQDWEPLKLLSLWGID